jgi:hypothetical protein
VNLEVQEAMKARGLGAERFTEVLAKLLRSKNERIRLEAMRIALVPLDSDGSHLYIKLSDWLPRTFSPTRYKEVR